MIDHIRLVLKTTLLSSKTHSNEYGHSHIISILFHGEPERMFDLLYAGGRYDMIWIFEAQNALREADIDDIIFFCFVSVCSVFCFCFLF